MIVFASKPVILSHQMSGPFSSFASDSHLSSPTSKASWLNWLWHVGYAADWSTIVQFFLTSHRSVNRLRNPMSAVPPVISLEAPSLEVTKLKWIWLSKNFWNTERLTVALYGVRLPILNIFCLMTSLVNFSVENPWKSKSTSWNLKYYLHAASLWGSFKEL